MSMCDDHALECRGDPNFVGIQSCIHLTHRSKESTVNLSCIFSGVGGLIMLYAILYCYGVYCWAICWSSTISF